MRKQLVLVVVVGLALTAAAAFAAPTALPLKKPGVLTVGFDVPAPGFWNGRATGTTIKNPTGFEYAALAGDREAAWRSRRSSSCARRSAGSSRRRRRSTTSRSRRSTITSQRAKVVDFSTPYFDANQGVLIRKGLPKPTSVADLKTLQLCAQKDTTGLAYIQHKLRPAKKPLVYSASSTAAFDAVEAGTCDALILDVPIVVVAEQEEAGRVRRRRRADRHARVLRRGHGEGQQVHAVPSTRRSRRCKANGTIGKLQKKWLPFTTRPGSEIAR